MNVLAILAIILTLVGWLWYAYEVYKREDLIWAVLLVLVPFPLLGLYIWYRADWDSCYKVPASLYFAGYALGMIVGVSQ